MEKSMFEHLTAKLEDEKLEIGPWVKNAFHSYFPDQGELIPNPFIAEVVFLPEGVQDD